jgi:hypothetical protein
MWILLLSITIICMPPQNSHQKAFGRCFSYCQDSLAEKPWLESSRVVVVPMAIGCTKMSLPRCAMFFVLLSFGEFGVPGIVLFLGTKSSMFLRSAYWPDVTRCTPVWLVTLVWKTRLVGAVPSTPFILQILFSRLGAKTNSSVMAVQGNPGANTLPPLLPIFPSKRGTRTEPHFSFF